MSSIVRVMDCETTGLDLEEDRPIEVAFVDVDVDELEIVTYASRLFGTDRRISYQAMATHLILPADIEFEPKWDAHWFDDIGAGGAGRLHVAHNAAFDSAMLGMTDRTWACTYRLLSHLWPDLESHGNVAAALELGIDFDAMPTEAGMMPHRALFDAWVTAQLLLRIVGEFGSDLEELTALSARPILQTTVRFGKNRGSKFCELPIRDLDWMAREAWEEDTRYTARYWLNQPREGYEVLYSGPDTDEFKTGNLYRALVIGDGIDEYVFRVRGASGEFTIIDDLDKRGDFNRVYPPDMSSAGKKENE